MDGCSREPHTDGHISSDSTVMISRRKLLLGVSALAIAVASPRVDGRLRGITIPPTNNPNANKVLMGGFAGNAFTFINFAKGWQFMPVTAALPPTLLNDDGYPTTPQNFGGSIPMPSLSEYSGQWVVKWTGGLAFRFLVATNVVSGSSFITGGGAGSGNTGFSGTNGRVVLTFAVDPSPNMSVGFVTSGASGGGGLILCRVADEAAVDAGAIFLPEFISYMRGLPLKAVRAMGWCTSGGSDGTANSNFNYRWKTTALGYFNGRYPAGAWGGTASTSDNVTYTCGNAPDSNPSAYVQGETIQLAWPAAASGASPTLNRNSLGAKPILTLGGGAMGSGALPASVIHTFVYDNLLNGFLCLPAPSNGIGGGIVTNVPVEIHVALANLLNVHMWKVFPILYTDTSVAAEVAYVRDHLSSGLNAYFELSNETWNNKFSQWSLCNNRGIAFGFPSDNNRRPYGYFSYRLRQVMGNATSTWTASRSRSQLKCVMSGWAYGGATTVGAQNLYRLQGTDLVGTTYPNYLAYNGGVDPGYNTFPNRAVDVCDALSYAPYYSGAQCTNFDANYIALGTSNITGLLTAADNYASGNPTLMASALAFLDNDIKAGTLASAGTLGTNTISYQTTNIFPAWETLATSYDGSGRPSGMSNLTVEQYENALESWYIVTLQAAIQMAGAILASSTVTLNIGSSPAVSWTAHGLSNGAAVGFATTGALPTGIGVYSGDTGSERNTNLYYVVNASANSFDVSLTPGGAAITLSGTQSGTQTANASNYVGSAGRIASLLNAYKLNATYGQGIVKAQFDPFFAESHSKTAAWLQLAPLNQWSLIDGDMLSGAPFQTYNGVAAYH